MASQRKDEGESTCLEDTSDLSSLYNDMLSSQELPNPLDHWEDAPEHAITSVTSRSKASSHTPKVHSSAPPPEMQNRCNLEENLVNLLKDIEDSLYNGLHSLETASNRAIKVEQLVDFDYSSPLNIASRAIYEAVCGLQRSIEGTITVVRHARAFGHSDSTKRTPSSTSSVVKNSPRAETHQVEATQDYTGSSSRSETAEEDLLPGQAPSFKHTPSLTPQFVPNYHADITTLSEPKIYNAPSSNEASSELNSRRVILKNLPPDATLAQVVKGVCGFGGTVRTMMLSGNPFCKPGTSTALIEFVYPKSAAEYAKFLRSWPLVYQARNADRYIAEAWLIPTTSFQLTNRDHWLLEKEKTKALRFSNFPKKGVWYFLSVIGLPNITYAGFVEGMGDLHIEFTNLAEADRIQRLSVYNNILTDICGGPGIVGVSFKPDLTQRPLEALKTSGGDGVIDFISVDAFEQEWNQSPFNDYWPTAYQSAMELQGLSPRPIQAPVPKSSLPPQPSTAERLAQQFDIDVDEVDDYLEERRNYKDTAFRILGSDIILTRRKWGWSIGAEDDLKLHMANTLHEPEWADEWDKHFAARGLVNLRKLESYGMLAKHRREKAKEQGLEPWVVLRCDKECAAGC